MLDSTGEATMKKGKNGDGELKRKMAEKDRHSKEPQKLGKMKPYRGSK